MRSQAQGISQEGCLPRWLMIKHAGGEEPAWEESFYLC